MSIATPAVGDPITADWGGDVAAALAAGPTQITDWDDATTPGKVYAAGDATNSPTTTAYTGDIDTYPGGYVTQLAKAIAHPLIYYRYKSGGTWSSWSQVL